jgi:hypothetical protein
VARAVTVSGGVCLARRIGAQEGEPMVVSAFRRLVTNLFRGTIVETPGLSTPIPHGTQEARPSRSAGPTSGIPDELAERSLPQISPLPQSPPLGD